MKKFEEEDRANRHYQKVISAKASIPNKERRRSLCHRDDPLKKFEFHNVNDKLVDKLRQIYDGGHGCSRLKRPVSGRSLVNSYQRKSQASVVEKDNLKMYQRIVAAKTTLTNWKNRENQLRKYSLLSSKSGKKNKNQSLYAEFRETLMEQAKRRSTRPKRKKNKKKCSSPDLKFSEY